MINYNGDGTIYWHGKAVPKDGWITIVIESDDTILDELPPECVFEYGLFHEGLGEFLRCGYDMDDNHVYYFPSVCDHVDFSKYGPEDTWQICVVEENVEHFLNDERIKGAMVDMGLRVEDFAIVRVHNGNGMEDMPDFADTFPVGGYLK